MHDIVGIVFRSLKYYKKPVLFQMLIIMLLAAVITGSFLVGSSVKENLKASAHRHLGNTSILISSGPRYFHSELTDRLKKHSGIKCTGVLELTGFSQKLGNEYSAYNSNIIAIEKDFFLFHGFESLSIKPGEIAVNQKLAEYLKVSQGDEIILRYTEVSDIPSDAPFAPSAGSGKSAVFKIGLIIDQPIGNFSLAINQVTPFNIFINISDIESNDSKQEINRILVSDDKINSLELIYKELKKSVYPEDIGLRLRQSVKTLSVELVSDRIFIDSAILRNISDALPSSRPVLTYLANRFKSGSHSTPYSFISALPESIYPESALSDGLVINSWMADDLAVTAGDSVTMFWYSPDSLNKLVEKNSRFKISKIVNMNGVWSDSLLMPDFPGISGKESCSDWDAGVPVKMNEIRPKDEAYWNRYHGTPKAFISYEKGRELWGNNFGPATSVRFPSGVNEDEILNKVSAALNPEQAGFVVTDVAGESIKAANESIDFGSLFLSLGFFLIVASLVLLSFATTSYFDSRKGQITTLFALGFNNRWISRLLFSETIITGLAGCTAGTFSGIAVSILLTYALNTIWTGAVQTSTLTVYFDWISVFSGFFLTFLVILIMMFTKTRRFIKKLNKKEREKYRAVPVSGNKLILFASSLITLLLIVSSFVSDHSMIFSFAGGAMLLITIVILWKNYFSFKSDRNSSFKIRSDISKKYFSFNPSSATAPVLFIAAGIFTVYITSSNKLNFSQKEAGRSGGTGGYILWCENAIPVKEDLNSLTGKKALGLDDNALSSLYYVGMKKYNGNDASCLNLNHIKVPPVIGVDPAPFVKNNAFAFSKTIRQQDATNAWQLLNISSPKNIIYGIADQTVLEWGLKLKVGDTLILGSESGVPLKIIIAAGLQSSVFQGNMLIGMKNFSRYFPSISGTNLFLVDGKEASADSVRNLISERLGNYGIHIEKTADRLSSFYQVTNTYLSVFSIFGALGILVGVIGLGFVLLRNYNQRKKDFAVMLALGFSESNVKFMVINEQLKILLAGVSAGFISAIVATLPSIRNNAEVPWSFLILITVTILLTGFLALIVSVRSVTQSSLTSNLKKE